MLNVNLIAERMHLDGEKTAVLRGLLRDFGADDDLTVRHTPKAPAAKPVTIPAPVAAATMAVPAEAHVQLSMF